MKLMTMAGAVTAALVLTMPAAQADDFDDVSDILQHVFPVHHTTRILVCSGDDDDEGTGCYHMRVPRGVYRGDDDDDGVRFRSHRRYYHDDDDNDDD